MSGFRALLVFGGIAWLTATATAGDRVTVALSSGGEVRGELLRENEQGVVIDLGYNVIDIPANAVLDVRRESDAISKDSAIDHGIYQTGRLSAADVPTLVKRVGDAVVVIRTPSGLGSGFVISSMGHLITNYHVVERETKILVTLFERQQQGYERHELKKVRILALQPLRDIALLQLDLDELEGKLPRPVVINDREDLRVGDMVFAVGSPLGLERSVSQGIVSSTTRTLGHLRLIQTDAAINPGNSGGPLFNARGEVVAIASAGMSFTDGLAFGVPSHDVVDFLKHYDAYLYDASQPQSGVKYSLPPFREPGPTQEHAGSSVTDAVDDGPTP